MVHRQLLYSSGYHDETMQKQPMRILQHYQCPPSGRSGTLLSLPGYGIHLQLDASCSDQAIEQCPRKHESAQTPKHVAQPQITQRSVEVCAGLAICLEREQQHRYHEGSHEVEDETGVRLEA